jgi:hypothetical protein
MHMKRRIFISSLATFAATAWLGLAMPAQAEDEFVYGRELMSEQEMTEHRSRMRNLSTEQEREMYRLEHHRQMQERARAQGKVLPDEPGPQGRGMGQGGGRGPGGGMGPGSGGGRMGPP